MHNAVGTPTLKVKRTLYGVSPTVAKRCMWNVSKPSSRSSHPMRSMDNPMQDQGRLGKRAYRATRRESGSHRAWVPSKKRVPTYDSMSTKSRRNSAQSPKLCNEPTNPIHCIQTKPATVAKKSEASRPCIFTYMRCCAYWF